mgnify:CR=1 FL=1
MQSTVIFVENLTEHYDRDVRGSLAREVITRKGSQGYINNADYDTSLNENT